MKINNKLKKILTFLIICIITIFIVLLVNREKNPKLQHEWYFEKINYFEAVKKYKKSNQKIAIIDSGYLENIGFNEKKIIKKYNFIDDNNDVKDENGHGTFLLSVLLGFNNDKLFIQGINDKVDVMILKIVNKNGITNSKLLSKAIYYAVENKANIINISLGIDNNNLELENAINHAIINNVIIVSAVGDTNSKKSLYPANYDDVLSVESQDYNGNRYFFSNIDDKTKVRFPGVNIKGLLYKPEISNLSISSITASSVSCILFSGIISIVLDHNKKIPLDYLKEKMNKNEFIDLKVMINQYFFVILVSHYFFYFNIKSKLIISIKNFSFLKILTIFLIKHLNMKYFIF